MRGIRRVCRLSPPAGRRYGLLPGRSPAGSPTFAAQPLGGAGIGSASSEAPASDRGPLLAAQDRRGAQHRLHRLEVAGAAAQHTGKRLAHFVLRWVRVALQQLFGGQDLRRGAVTALDRPALDKCLLQRVQPGGRLPALLGMLAERFDGLDRCPSAWAASITQELTGLPSSSTAHAPHSPLSQPCLTPK